MKLLLQQLGTLGEVLDCTTLCKLSPHLCLPRANQTRQIWAMGRRGATASVGFYYFFKKKKICRFLVNLLWGLKSDSGSVWAPI